MFEIGDGKCRAGIAIPRLADGTGIQQVTSRSFDTQGRERLRGTRMNLQDFQL
jgi:hypothetical protein